MGKKRKFGLGVDLAAEESSAFVVATEVMPDGTHKVHRAQPFLRPAVEGVLQRWQEELAKSVLAGKRLHVSKARGGGRLIPNSLLGHPLFAGLPRPPMAHPVWPYGTVIRPIGESLKNYRPEMRQIVIASGVATVTSVHLNEFGKDIAYLMYVHLRENMHELWEEVPD